MIDTNQIKMVFDLEATCWKDKPYHPDMEIIEIGAVLLDQDLEVLGEYQSFVCPILNPVLSDFCKELTHIKQDDLYDAVMFKYVLRGWEEWVRNTCGRKLSDVTIISWGMFDLNLLRAECKRQEIRWPFGIHRSLKDEFEIVHSLDHCSLREAMQIAGITFEGEQHRALTDAKNTARLIPRIPPRY